MRRKVLLSVLSTLVVGLVVMATQPMQAAVGNLGASWEATQQWVTSLTPETFRSSAIPLVNRILGAPQVEQGGGGTPAPTVTTDKPDYHPGETVIVTGAGWQPNSVVALIFHEAVEPQDHADVTLYTNADASGNIDTSGLNTPNDDYVLQDHHVGVSFVLTATGFAADGSAAQVATTFTDSAAANIDQCRTGSATSPSDCVDAGATEQNNNAGWVNGNAGSSNSHFIEGYSIPYRVRMTELPVGTPIMIDLGYDIKHSDKHALDFLTHYQRLEPHLGFGHPAETVFPLSGTGVSGTPTNWPIPVPSSQVVLGQPQPATRFGSLPAGERVMTLWGGTLSDVEYLSEGDLAANQSETVIRVFFTPTSATAVLAWGGHIAMAEDWGAGQSASGVNGSPYHMRLKDWECDDGIDGSKQNTASQCDQDLGNLGNQDRSLSAAAVFPTGTITVRKIVTDGSADGTFDFSALLDTPVAGPPPATLFSLTSGGVLWEQSFTVLANAGTGGNTNLVHTVEELGPPLGYDFVDVVCTDSVGIADSTVLGQVATPKVSGGETVICTFKNQQDLSEINGKIVVVKETVPSPDPLDTTFAFTTTGTGYSGFDLKNGESNDTGFTLTPGTFSVAETADANYTTTSGCTSTQVGDASTPASISLEAGETVTCTFTNTRNLGSLKISKVFDPLTSGFAGTFAINYNCDDGTDHDGTVNLAAGGNQTIGGIPTGTSCVVTEPSTPSAPTGWTFGTPSLSDSQAPTTDGTVVITDKDATYEVTVTNTISHDVGSLKISKVFDPLTSGFAGTFAINYNCDDGTAHDGTVNLAAGANQTISGIPTGTSCVVTEPSTPSAPTGWTFGTPSLSDSQAPADDGTVVITDKDATYEVTVTNTISRNLGSLKISKVFDPLTSGFVGTFAINYNCDDGTDHDGTVNLAAGGNQTIGGIPTGTSCVVTEPSTPSAPTGWTFGTPSLSDSQAPTTDGTVVITDKDATYEVTVTNTISRNVGSLKISKVFDPLTSGFVGTFAINYNCDDGTAHDGTVNLAAGGNQTIGGIPTGTSCVVTEPSTPSAPTGWTFGTPSLSDSQAPTTDGTVVITDKDATYEVAVTNTITRDLGSLKIIKSVVGAPAGFTGSFSVDVSCTLGGGTFNDQIISYPTPGFVTIQNIPTGSVCTVTEDTPTGAPTGYTWGTVVVSGTATIAKDTTSEVTVTNTVTGRAKVVKTKAGSALVTGDAFVFQLRTGASTTAVGTIEESLTATALNQGVLNFTTVLVPGQHYQLCELVMPGWNTNLSGTLFVPGSIIPPTLPNPNVDNSPVCVDFVAQAGVTTTFNVDNTFPGGLARTIGFWKNWSSCSGGRQTPVLDQTLQTAQAIGGLVVSAQSGTYAAFSGTIYLRLLATDCAKAVALLNKSNTSNGKKMASDPAFNLAAQLVAAELNFVAGAGQNGTAINAVNQAVVLLGKYGFNGAGYTGKISSTDAATMNSLATILDNYNNNLP